MLYSRHSNGLHYLLSVIQYAYHGDVGCSLFHYASARYGGSRYFGLFLHVWRLLFLQYLRCVARYSRYSEGSYSLLCQFYVLLGYYSGHVSGLVMECSSSLFYARSAIFLLFACGCGFRYLGRIFLTSGLSTVLGYDSYDLVSRVNGV